MGDLAIYLIPCEYMNPRCRVSNSVSAICSGMAPPVPATGGRLWFSRAAQLRFTLRERRGDREGFPFVCGDGWKFSELFSIGNRSSPFKCPG